MNKRIIIGDHTRIAVIEDFEPVVTDAQSMLDLMATIEYYDECFDLIFHKSAICEEFFDLSTGLAGDILQKVVNYQRRIAIAGDFSGYSSKALHDFIYECNQGNHIFWVADEQEAVRRMDR